MFKFNKKIYESIYRKNIHIIVFKCDIKAEARQNTWDQPMFIKYTITYTFFSKIYQKITKPSCSVTFV